ncbi:hypothetical protein [Domibacillus indicus]|uniref:hypothetical protein n=1 Tax=Domibacillus indicus TaxID=1437523 RepID=UPI000A7D4955|nr:hypothetical protein [Domibacillus indicus]
MLTIDFFASVLLALIFIGLIGSLMFITEKPKLLSRTEYSNPSKNNPPVYKKGKQLN